jgi:hypothetical protein
MEGGKMLTMSRSSSGVRSSYGVFGIDIPTIVVALALLWLAAAVLSRSHELSGKPEAVADPATAVGAAPTRTAIVRSTQVGSNGPLFIATGDGEGLWIGLDERPSNSSFATRLGSSH